MQLFLLFPLGMMLELPARVEADERRRVVHHRGAPAVGAGGEVVIHTEGVADLVGRELPDPRQRNFDRIINSTGPQALGSGQTLEEQAAGIIARLAVATRSENPASRRARRESAAASPRSNSSRSRRLLNFTSSNGSPKTPFTSRALIGPAPAVSGCQPSGVRTGPVTATISGG